MLTLWKLFGLLLFGVFVRQLVWARMGGFLFLTLCNRKQVY